MEAVVTWIELCTGLKVLFHWLHLRRTGLKKLRHFCYYITLAQNSFANGRKVGESGDLGTLTNIIEKLEGREEPLCRS